MRSSNPFPYLAGSLYLSIAFITLMSAARVSSAQSAEFTQGNTGNNAVTMEVPLANYPGRGISLPVTLHYSTQGLWRIGFINSTYETVSGYQVLQPNAEAIYAEHSTAGWKTSLDVPELEWPKQNDAYWATGKPYALGWYPGYTYRIARVLIHMPDGSTHELRRSDQIYSDASVEMNGQFYAVDGSRMRYDGNSDGTGVLYLADGTRYVLNGSTTQYIDRNGNTLSYNATNRQWTDTMGRVIGMPWPANPGAGDYTYSLPGIGNTSISYTLKFRNLSDVFLPDVANQTLKPMSDYYLPSPGAMPGPGNLPQGPLTAGSTLFTGGWANPDDQSNAHDFTYVVGRGQSGNGNFNPVVLSEIDLPNGQSYRFSYNAYGELDKVIYPTGGYQRYLYGQVTTTNGSPAIPYDQGTRGMLSRWVSPSGNGGDEAQWTYSASTYPLSVTAPNGTRSDTYLFYPQSSQSNNFGYQDARTGLPSEERIYAPASQGGAMLRRTLIDYGQSSNTYNRPSPGTATYTAYRNARPIKTVSLILDTGGNALASTTTTGYDTNHTYEFTVGLDATSSSQYDFATVDQNTAQTGAIGSMPTGALVRTTTTTNLTGDPNYYGRNILGLPVTTTVYNAAGTMVAQTTVSYDEGSYPLINYGSITGWTDPQTTIRGNPTTSSHWLDYPTPTFLQTHAQYDQCGSLRKAWDARDTSLLNPTQIDYSSTYAYAYPTQTTGPVPDSSGQYGSNTSLVASTVYDLNTGLVISTTDANGQTTTFEYNDPLDRPTKVNLPDGGQTTHAYVDSSSCGASVETRTLLDSSRWTDSYQYFDGLGRGYRALSYENQDTGNPWITLDTQYDTMGRAYRVSSPYRSAGCTSTVNPSGHWTTSSFDALGRGISVTTPDGAQATTAYSASLTGSYIGSTVTVTDQAGKRRQSVSDGLGRLIAVYEDPNGVNFLTSYAYDALGNLRSVNQGGQQRFFMYDALGRVVRAKNPEQDANSALNVTDPVSGNSGWSMAYSYDNDGNVVSRVDARNLTTTYAFDALNRNKTITYSDGTPAISHFYDGATIGKGRLWYEQTNGASNVLLNYKEVSSYDAMGRPLVLRQMFVANSVNYNFYSSQTYNKAGAVTSETYPSGHTVNYNYDQAGRLADKDGSNLAFTGNLGDGVTRTYATGISYSELGGLQQEQFGTATALYHKLHYNIRGQLYDNRLSTVSWSADQWNWNRGGLLNWYDSTSGFPRQNPNSGTDNNGTLRRSETWVPTDDQMNYTNWDQQNYSYDTLNRLASVTELQNGNSASYVQSYDYDRWGNRTINSGSWGATNINMQFDKSDGVNTNRLYAPGDTSLAMNQRQIQYDAAGNQTNDSYSYPGWGESARTYDAENHMTQAYANNQWQIYTYEADGRRVKRNVNGNETWAIYGFGGELLAEYKSGAATFLPTKEYGYRGGQLLVTMASGDDARLSRFVTNLYYGALQRDPTSTELQNGINQLAAAGALGQSQLFTSASSLARGLFTQTGYETSPNRSDTQYVSDLYYTYLQRGPDDSGLGWWVGQLSNGRAAVCNAFEASGEFQTLVATLYGTASSDNQRTELFVNNFYRGAYGRDATTTEIQTQRDALNAAAAQGQSQVQAQAETFGRSLFAVQVSDYSISDQQFVTNLYESFLQRGPDAGGLGFWTSVAGGGSQNRQNVLNAFATCGSFYALADTLYREEFWLVADHLGTPRMIVDKSGSLAGVKRHDYLPFGEEIYANTGGRSATQGYVGDSTRQKFTGYEADNETGLNFAQARYQSSSQGRFTSVDPLKASSSIASPQSLNRYSYVENDPVNFTDPTGMMLSDIGVYQTNDPEEADTLQRKSDSDFQRAINGDYVRTHSMPFPFIDTPDNHMGSGTESQNPHIPSGGLELEEVGVRDVSSDGAPTTFPFIAVEVANEFNAALSGIASAEGKDFIGFTEMFRTSEYQQYRRGEYESGRSSIYAKRARESAHEAGLAFDVPTGLQTPNVISIFAKHGFVRAELKNNDLVHFEWVKWQSMSRKEQLMRIDAIQHNFQRKHPGVTMPALLRPPGQ